MYFSLVSFYLKKVKKNVKKTELLESLKCSSHYVLPRQCWVIHLSSTPVHVVSSSNRVSAVSEFSQQKERERKIKRLVDTYSFEQISKILPTAQRRWSVWW